jgi:hypothetical protein
MREYVITRINRHTDVVHYANVPRGQLYAGVIFGQNSKTDSHDWTEWQNDTYFSDNYHEACNFATWITEQRVGTIWLVAKTSDIFERKPGDLSRKTVSDKGVLPA